MPLNSIDVEQPHSDGKDTRRFPSEVEEECKLLGRRDDILAQARS